MLYEGSTPSKSTNSLLIYYISKEFFHIGVFYMKMIQINGNSINIPINDQFSKHFADDHINHSVKCLDQINSNNNLYKDFFCLISKI